MSLNKFSLFCSKMGIQVIYNLVDYMLGFIYKGLPQFLSAATRC